jgi:hypothetical protein
MVPRVDLSEQILEMMGWQPGFPAAFTSVTGGRCGSGRRRGTAAPEPIGWRLVSAMFDREWLIIGTKG